MNDENIFTYNPYLLNKFWKRNKNAFWLTSYRKIFQRIRRFSRLLVDFVGLIFYIGLSAFENIFRLIR